MFTVDPATGELKRLDEEQFADLGILERDDLEEWVIRQPDLLDEELLIITSEYAGFEQTRDRLDILALDRLGKVVVIELKRDQADTHTDLQAIKYASYCSTLTAEDLQKEYRSFWSDRRGEELSPEQVGEEFIDFLGPEAEDTIEPTDEGWADFGLDDQPRIILAAGSFGLEVTAPVMWLTREYGLDISCVRFDAYEDDGRVLLTGRTVIPVPEAEEYMTKRREKEERQRQRERRPAAIFVLLDRGVLRPGDIVVFDRNRYDPKEFQRDYDPDDDYWRAEVTGQRGQSDNVRWLHNGQTYSFTSLSKVILEEQTGRDPSVALNGYKFWTHPEFGGRRLSDLRNEKVTADERTG